MYALVNRPYITDLEAGRSLLESLLDMGCHVYLIDWGYPDSTDLFTGFDDYVNGYINRCVNRACEDANIDQMNLLGICQGGTMSLCYSALHPDRVSGLITLVTPVDFHAGPNLLSEWVAEIQLDEFVQAFGNVSGDLVTRMFKNMKPFLLNREKYRQLGKIMDDPERLATFLKMETWIHDSPDLAGTMVREYGRWLYQENALHRGTLELDGKVIKLESIHCPVLNIYAEQDHIVPPDSSRALSQHIQPELYQETCLPGGHIGVFTSKKSLEALSQTLKQWFANRR